jgi:hypothetical protein
MGWLLAAECEAVKPVSDKGNKYAIAALKDRRATMAGEIIQFKEAIRYREEQLAHLDATLRVLDPSYRADTLPPKRLRRVKLFGGGELNRLILDALRRSDGQPMTNLEIARSIIEAKGYGEAAIHSLTRRVRANLSYLLRVRRMVVKTGERLEAKWSLRQIAQS